MLVSKKTVYVGADIVTMSEKAPKAEAVCIADGRIECVGSREEVLGYAKAGEYDVVDFGGGTLYPGFIDTHTHFEMNKPYVLVQPLPQSGVLRRFARFHRRRAAGPARQGRRKR